MHKPGAARRQGRFPGRAARVRAARAHDWSSAIVSRPRNGGCMARTRESI
ncbi:hypothetical protein BSIN_0914 [Burkholderia singularis]|uniref:Uncharacterized protein n=1 Tax=Burkholderia singularis TaxID=1503053 RepID=A0A238HAB8_9BURK|nr:hypothetical protein BSIN_0914 [Burkholderia singularis]